MAAHFDNNSAYVENIEDVEKELIMEQLRLTSAIIAATQIILQVAMCRVYILYKMLWMLVCK